MNPQFVKIITADDKYQKQMFCSVISSNSMYKASNQKWLKYTTKQRTKIGRYFE